MKDKLKWYHKAIILFFCWPSMLLATPIFAMEQDGVRVVLTDEPCQIRAVANLPYRAVWTEKGKDFEGCWGPRPQEGVVMGYFSDLTVVAIPIQLFKRVTDA